MIAESGGIAMAASNTIGELIVVLRARNRMSQQDLADYLYVNQGTVSRWERGVRFPDTELIYKMASRFGVDPSVLLDAPLNRSVRTTVILVEDEPVLLEDSDRTLREVLPAAEVASFRWLSDAMEYAKTHRVDVAFLDIELVGGDGLSIARYLMERNPRVNIIFLTSHPEYAGEALNLFCSGYVLKPLSREKILTQMSHLRYPEAGVQP
jgi:transcriptional regulator with XRE-family HTH domain